MDCSDAADMDVGKAFTYIPQFRTWKWDTKIRESLPGSKFRIMKRLYYWYYYFFSPSQRIPHTAVHLDMNVNSIQRVDKYVCKNYQNLQDRPELFIYCINSKWEKERNFELWFKELKLDDNLIKDIHADAFKYCKDLRILTLRNNKITSLKDGLVSKL